MLPKKNRIPRSEFSPIYRQGKRISGLNTTLIYKPGLPGAESRFGFVVSLKVSKKANKRNRCRRLLSESVASLMPRLKHSIDSIFLVRNDFSQCKKEDIEQTVEEVLQKADII